MKKFIVIIMVLFMCTCLFAVPSYAFNTKGVVKTSELSCFDDFKKSLDAVSSEAWYVGSWDWGCFSIYPPENYFGIDPKFNVLCDYLDTYSSDGFLCILKDGVIEIWNVGEMDIEFDGEMYSVRGFNLHPTLIIFNLSSLEKVKTLSENYRTSYGFAWYL